MVLFLKNLLFTVLVPGTFAAYLPLRIVQERSAPAGPLFVLGCLAIAVGTSIYAWCVWDFATFGRGTPAPIDAPKKLVVRGLYRYTRNPMYCGVLTVIFGWALVFRAPEIAAYGLIVWACFHSFVVLYEEPHLRSEFGPEYEAYSTRVRRWLPGFRDRTAPRAS
ncbi:MAG: methyltransferase family protein [Candidatus Binatia bacterium]